MKKQTPTSIVTGLFLLAFGMGSSVQAVPVSWSTPSGFVCADGVTPLLQSGSAWYQLIWSADGVASPPDVDGWVTGDDMLLADYYLNSTTAGLYGQHFAATYTNTPGYGYVFIRVFEDWDFGGDWDFYTSPLVALQSSFSLPYLYQAVTEGTFAGGASDNGMGHYVLGGDGSGLGEAVDAPQLVWSTGEQSSWAPTSYNTHDGVDAAESYVGPYSDSWIETSVTGPIAVSFWWQISSSSYMGGGDLSFSIDGVSQGSLYYSYGWQYAAYAVPAGSHTLRWNLYGGYSDPFYGGGGASGGLDQVVLSPVAPEIEVLGVNSSVISNGASVTSTTNGTDFSATFLTGAMSNRTFTIRNWGTTNLEISAVTTSGGHSNDFQIIGFPSAVQPFTASNLEVRFDPSALGGRTAVVTVVNNDADEGNYTFAVSGTGIADGSYLRVLGGTGSLAPITNGSTTVTNTLGTDFGVQYLTGSSTQRTFYVTNAGNAVLNIAAVNIGGTHTADFQVVSFPATVAAGVRTNLVIQFDPVALGARSAVVEITSDNVEAPVYTLAVGGMGIPDTPEILVLGTNLQSILDGNMTVSAGDGTYFGGTPVSSGSIDRVFLITNLGSVDLVISNVTFQGAGAAHFSVPSVPPIVSPRSQSNLTIRFTPAAAGVATAVVLIANNDVDENPYEFAVRGDGISTHYVWTNSPNPTPPFNRWETAARTIQEAANVCVDGDMIWVTNGVYNTGGVSGNRVTITNAVGVVSVNGPAVTIIDGGDSVRGAYLGNNAVLAGFTITNGYAETGGGVYGQGQSAVVSNCVISGNVANSGGGGAAYASLYQCQIVGNQAAGWVSMLPCWDYYMSSQYTLEGGGGGAYNCRLESSLLHGNTANAGGGAAFSTLINCTLVSNQAAGIASMEYFGGGGIFEGSAVNCIFADNADAMTPTTSDYDSTPPGCYGGTTPIAIFYSCLTNPPFGIGNVTGRATFVVGTYRLAAGSLGIDVGANASVQGATDLDGNPRIVNGTVDMGAYEFQGQANPDTDGDGIPDDWESTHGLNPAVSNSPTMNSDDDDQPDVDEYIADTQPTNSASYFPLVVLTNPPLGNMVLIVDPTSTARVYGVRWTTNLLATPQLWTLIPPEIIGTGSAVTFTVTNDGPGRIYRTGVRLP